MMPNDQQHYVFFHHKDRMIQYNTIQYSNL